MYMNGIPPSPPIKKTPLVGVFFIGVDGESLEVSASRKREKGGRILRRGLPRAERGGSISLHLRHKGHESNVICSVRVFFYGSP